MKYDKIQYCIVDNGKVENNSIRWSRNECIKKFISNNPFYTDWKYAYSLGVRCVKIEITIEPAVCNKDLYKL